MWLVLLVISTVSFVWCSDSSVGDHCYWLQPGVAWRNVYKPCCAVQPVQISPGLQHCYTSYQPFNPLNSLSTWVMLSDTLVLSLTKIVQIVSLYLTWQLTGVKVHEETNLELLHFFLFTSDLPRSLVTLTLPDIMWKGSKLTAEKLAKSIKLLESFPDHLHR